MRTSRAPEIVPARIAPLANLPLFHRLEGRKAVVAGGSQGALWKAELLSSAGAEVLVLAGHESAARLFEGLARTPVAGPVAVLSRGWRDGDLDGAAIAIADLADEGEVRRFALAAREAGAIVNLIDRAEMSDVQFGTIVNRSPVVLAISTDGGAPMLGQSIRARIEAVLPRGLAGWAEAAKAWRPRLRGHFAAFADRRAFWARFTSHAWANVECTPEEADFESLVAAAPVAPGGSVTLVGAGPGDPDLLTLKAVRALQAATVILYDDLVGGEILELARREAVRIAVGKRGHGASVAQAEISRRIVALACAGETVVRLKGGDPGLFGRATEEILACRDAGVPVAIVPGITAARRVQYVTGHDADGRLPEDIDWRAIADPGATTIVYMPRGTLAAFADNARCNGLDQATPALAISAATRPDQAHVAGTLADIAALTAALPAGAPVTVIIGQVARHAAAAALLSVAA